MNIKEILGALADSVLRQACRSCIERCHAIAGQFDCADSASAAFFERPANQVRR